MAAGYDDTGPVVPWRVKVSDPIAKTWTIATDTGTPIDVSAATVTGRVAPSESLAETATATFTMTKPTNFSVKASFPAGIAVLGPKWWAIKVVFADGTVWRGQGPFIVEPAGV